MTEARLTEELPSLYTSSYILSTLMSAIFEMPITKQIASKMFDFPEPLSPVMALNWGSRSFRSVRTEKLLNPSMTISMRCIFINLN